MDKKITQERLKHILTYSPRTGQFVNNLSLGPVGSISKKNGHVAIGVDGGRYSAHRLAFLYMTGIVPEAVMHINGNKADNRWSNLAPMTTIEAARYGAKIGGAKIRLRWAEYRLKTQSKNKREI